MAANFNTEEQNAEYKFHFMLHADKKSASKWKDLKLPFPAVKRDMAIPMGDTGGVKQLAVQAPHFKITHFPRKKEE